MVVFKKKCPAGEFIELDENGNVKISSSSWVAEGKYHSASILDDKCKFSSNSMHRRRQESR